MTSNSQVDTAGFITVGREQKNVTAENKEEAPVKPFDFQQSFARIVPNTNVFTVIGFGEESSEEDEKYEHLVVEEVEEDSSASGQPETESSEDDKTLEQNLDQMEREIGRDIERVTTKSSEIPVEIENWAIILLKPTYIPTTIRAPCKKPKIVRFAEVEIIEINGKEVDLNTKDPKKDNGNIDSTQIIVKSHESENRREGSCQKRMAYEAKKLELETKKMDLKKKKMDLTWI